MNAVQVQVTPDQVADEGAGDDAFIVGVISVLHDGAAVEAAGRGAVEDLAGLRDHRADVAGETLAGRHGVGEGTAAGQGVTAVGEGDVGEGDVADIDHDDAVVDGAADEGLGAGRGVDVLPGGLFVN